MAIKYTVKDKGHFIHTVAFGTVTDKDLMNYEIESSQDENIKLPTCELFEIKVGTILDTTRDGTLKVLEEMKKLSHPLKYMVLCFY